MAIDDNSVIEPEDQFGPPGEAYREIIREQKKLITELADALYDHLKPCTGKTLTDEEKLIQRAREAAK